jgi:N-acetylglucosaminyl-diphospho-decaprenol L-rhamnosyltransferase
MSIVFSFIILDYLKADKVIENIKSLLSQDFDYSIEIIVGDNSEDENNFNILEKNIKCLNKKNIQLVKFSKNIGYSKANNYLTSLSKGKYFCILNPDIKWEDKNSLKILFEYLQNNKVGILAPLQLEENNKKSLHVRRFPSLFIQIVRRTFLRKIFLKNVNNYEMSDLDMSKIQKVDWVQSSCILISRKNWYKIKGFDESYFLFMADTQICKDLWKLNLPTLFFPNVKVLSDGIRCSHGGFLSLFYSKTIWIHLKDSIIYFFKNL